MKVKVLASGSKGNSTYIECGNLKILIDAGISFLQIKKALEDINVDIFSIDIILITHSHSDHIKGLLTLLKKTNIKLCTEKLVYDDLVKTITPNNFEIIDKEMNIDNVKIQSFHLSHDVECYGYIIEYDRKELVYITDTGYLNKKYIPRISNKDIYVIETNHDEEMLMNGPYPFVLKQRIISDSGHLSNQTTAKLLKKVIGPQTKYIFLAHISEHNNDKQLALDTVKKELSDTDFNLDNILLTDQYISLDTVEV